MRIAVLHGPNLNLLGTREPAIYGTLTLDEIDAGLRELGERLGATVVCSQHNGEGELVEAIHALRGRADGAVVNAGAYSHTSLAIRDALAGIAMPFVEVHLSNIHAREPERRHSMLAPAARGVVCGFGATSYELGLRGLLAALAAR